MAQAALLSIIYLAFISLGLPDSVFGVAWPAMRHSLEQPLAAAGLFTLIVTAGSAASSMASAAVLQRLGTGVVVMLSGLLTGLALLGLTWAPSMGWVLACAVPLGLGAGSVDAGLNHFVAEHYASRHMNWLHGCWGVGATIGPLVMGAALVADTQGWRPAYQLIGSLQLALALLFLASLRLWRLAPTAPVSDVAGPSSAPVARVVPAWASWLAPCLYLMYATTEVSTGLWAASILVDGRGLDAPSAGRWVSCFFGAIMGGRFAVGLVAARLGNRRLVRLGLTLAIAGALLFAMPWLPAPLSLAGLVLLGLGCAPIYPSLMHETTRRFDPATARQVVGRLVAFAYVGGALGPATLGLLGAHWGLATIMPAIVLALVVLLILVVRLDRVT